MRRNIYFWKWSTTFLVVPLHSSILTMKCPSYLNFPNLKFTSLCTQLPSSFSFSFFFFFYYNLAKMYYTFLTFLRTYWKLFLSVVSLKIVILSGSWSTESCFTLLYTHWLACFRCLLLNFSWFPPLPLSCLIPVTFHQLSKVLISNSSSPHVWTTTKPF